MPKSLNIREQVVETICSEGCKYVNQFVASLDMQSKYEDLQDLSDSDQQWVIVELRSIMKVYERSGSCSI